MKTTIDVSDELLERCRRIAQRDGDTLKTLFEQGLRLVIQHREQRKSGKLRIEPFAGDGLTAEFEDADWRAVRDEIYRDRR